MNGLLNLLSYLPIRPTLITIGSVSGFLEILVRQITLPPTVHWLPLALTERTAYASPLRPGPALVWLQNRA